VEFSLPAVVPGALIGVHYAAQLLRPRVGYSSDRSGRRTPWIIGGMAALAIGGMAAAVATVWTAAHPIAATLLAVSGYLSIGVGVGAAGVSLLALLAARVAPGRLPVAATLVWLMMIAGFVLSTALVGEFLDPYSPERLLIVAAAVCGLSFALSLVAVIGVERATPPASVPTPVVRNESSFGEALREVWADRRSRRFAIFIFVSMLAYSGQELILEPFAGKVFGMTPGETARLAATQNAGVLLGMIGIALVGSISGPARSGSMRGWAIAGCVASTAALAGMSASAVLGAAGELRGILFMLGLANGAYAVSAIAWMMALAGRNGETRHGVRMGVWGAGQAIAFGLGGFLATGSVDLAGAGFGAEPRAYAAVFAAQAVAFLVAAGLAIRVDPVKRQHVPTPVRATAIH
jgi:BCD family chlorophyll transporter-like MFS transporter